jgi:PAP2 superfamily protein
MNHRLRLIIGWLAQEIAAARRLHPAGAPDPGSVGQTGTATSVRKRIIPEILLVGLGYLVYSQVRGLAGDRVSDAFANARQLVSLEQDLGIYAELTMQRWILPHAGLVDLFNLIYFYSFFPLIIPSAVWLFWKRPQIYVLARTAFLTSGAIAVLFFLTLPTAPPRLLGVGFVDTLNQSFTPTYSSIPGVNHYAALPSMHVGWTFLLAVAIVIANPGTRWRWIAFAVPAAMFTSTVVTGNHWFLDCLLGLIVAMIGLAAAVMIQRYKEKRALRQPLAPEPALRSSP